MHAQASEDEGKKEDGKSYCKADLFCSNYAQTGHIVDKYWEKYLHMKPKGSRRKKYHLSSNM